MVGTLKPDSQVHFAPFVTRREDGEVLLGRAGDGVFVTLPEEAFEIVEALASGKTVEETRRQYSEQHGEVPDIEDLVSALRARGFVIDSPSARRGPHSNGAPRQFHFDWISPRFAQAVFSRPMLVCCAGIILAAAAALGLRPTLIPTWKAFFFERNMTALIVALMLLGLVTTFLHEMAHLVAARAKGVSCRVGVSSRLWILVAETDMTGIWALSRRDRYLPLLAGPLFDLTAGSILIFVLFAGSNGWLHLSLALRQFMSALVLGAMLRLLWQCFFFVRTDFYYVVANIFGCKSLMRDTQTYLLYQFSRWTGRGPRRELPEIPARELAAVRVYSVFWLAGRAVAFASLFLITIPLIWRYSIHLGSSFAAPGSLSRYQLVDTVLITAIPLSIILLGLGLWVRRLIRARISSPRRVP